jgi:hypothetical protein
MASARPAGDSFAITKAQMDEWFARDLSGTDLVVVMLDG